jgi:uncharacterized protein YcfJ
MPATIWASLAIDLPQRRCKQESVIATGRIAEMIRNLAIAALVASVLAMPSHEAAAQNTLGGAIVGGVGGAIVGGAIGGRRGAAIGAVIGAGTGAAIASEGERRRGGYYYYRDGCYMPRPDGAYVLVDPRYCY